MQRLKDDGIAELQQQCSTLRQQLQVGCPGTAWHAWAVGTWVPAWARGACHGLPSMGSGRMPWAVA